MARPPSSIPMVRQNLTIPAEMAARIDLLLFSELEGRVPQGAYQTFFTRLLREYFESNELDLTPYGLAGMSVRGNPYTLAKLAEAIR